MYPEPFAPVLTINRMWNAIMRRSAGDNSNFQAGMLVQAQPMFNGKWSIHCPPFTSYGVVDGSDLIPIIHAD